MNKILESLDLYSGLKYLSENYKGKVVFSSSFGQEDQVITHEIFSNDLEIEIFTLDTGRLFPETYELMDKTRSRYNKNFNTYFPNSELLESFVREKGFNSFYESVENRKTCCGIRKIDGLKRALAGKEIWITGLRAEQSENRNDMKVLEFDKNFNIYKYNPLINWTLDEINSFIEINNIPQNTLHKKGFVSIGCQPCTRAIKQSEHPRAGRWWWESSQKECGLHEIKK